MAELLGLFGAARDLGHRHRLEVAAQERQQIAALGLVHGAQREFLAAAAGGNQTDADLDQADVAFQRRDHPVAVHQELTAAAQRQPLRRRYHRNRRITQRSGGLLELGDALLKRLEIAGHHHRNRLSQIGAGAERGFGLPDHHADKLLLGDLERLQYAVQHVIADHVHPALEADHADAVAGGPQPHAAVLPDRLAVAMRRFAQHQFGIRLALIDRQGGTRLVGILGRRVGAFRPMHAIHLLDPRRQRGLGHRLAGSDVFLDPLRDLSPAGGLPDLERPHAPAEAPANGQVNIAGGIGDFGQQHRRIVEHVALDGPQELGFWMVAGAQRGKFFSRVLDLEDRLHRCIRLGAGILVSARNRIEHLLALAGVNAGLGLLAQRALGDQRVQPGGRDEVLPPRILLQRQRRTLDHVAQGVQPDHVGGAEGGALGPANRRAGQRVHQVQPQPEGLGVVHGGGHREHADAVGDEVGGVLGADHALAQRADQEGFQQVQNGWIGGLAGNHFHQRHVARRVEEVDAAEPGAHVFGHRLGQHTQRQAGGIGG